MRDDFLDLLYEAALEPGLWHEAIRGLTEAVGADIGSLAQLDVATGRGSVVGPWINPEALAAYDQYYAAINPLVVVKNPASYVRDWDLKVFSDAEWIDREELTRTEYFNDFLQPLEREWSMTVRLGLQQTEVSSISLYRRADKGPFSGEEVEVARSVHAHVVRAFRLTRKLAGVLNLSVAEAVAPGQALMMLDDDGRILDANSEAEVLLSRGEGLYAVGGRLLAREHHDAERLDGLIRRAASPDRALRRGGAMATMSRTGSPPLSITVSPVRSERSSLFAGSPGVLVSVSDRSVKPMASKSYLQDMFSLTNSEARVASALADGLSVAEIAEKYDVAIKTVRVQLSSIFAKTNTHRQGELVSLIVRSI